MNTIEWAAVMCWSANAVSSGKPMTTPKAVMISGPISRRSGRRWRKTASTIPVRMAAIEARATVRNTGSKSATAARVAGSDPEKISMPRNPLTQPMAVLSMPLLWRSSSGAARDRGIQFPQTVLVPRSTQMDHTPPAAPTRVEHVMESIRQRIASRLLTPGAKLPSIRASAGALGVAKSTVVEAYDRLIADGTIASRRGSAAILSPPNSFSPS
jgi:Bacterial regulatory proteins, gntR family